MAKAIVVYGSTTGNTERLSEAVAGGLQKGGVDVTVRDVIDEVHVDELTDYDLIVLGSSTWGEGELQDDFIDFYSKMGSVSLTGKKAAAFGPGDSELYPDTFCAAVDLLEYRLKECGAEIVAESLKVDGDVDSVMEDVEAWGLEVAESL